MARQDTTAANPGIVPHVAYVTWAPVWQQLMDVYEGAGGFLDPSRPYLRAHPREWLDHSIAAASGDGGTPGRWVVNPSPSKASPKLITRRALARYENIASTLIDQLKAALFRKPPTRTFLEPATIDDGHPLRVFWSDADGLGRGIDAVMSENWTSSAVFGHTLLYGDRLGDTGSTPTRADQPRMVVRGYTPLDLIDWLTDDRGGLVAVRLLESVPRTTFDAPGAGAVVSQVRTVDANEWRLLSVDKHMKAAKAQPSADTAQGAHGFGILPVVLLYARRRALLPTIGRSVLGDPLLYIDLYNLTSEVRELLRNQTFALLNVPLGVGGNLETETTLLGQTSGTQNVVFSSQPIAYVSPDGTNVQVYHEHIDRLVRLIYRLAVVGWDSDSRDAESAESRKLKKEDLHQMLSGYAAECELAEMKLCELVYRASYGDGWERAWEADRPSVSYPDDFDVTGLLDELEAVTQGLALELGETATKALKKRAVPRLLPNLLQPELTQIEQEIDAMKVETASERERELMALRFGEAVTSTQEATEDAAHG